MLYFDFLLSAGCWRGTVSLVVLIATSSCSSPSTPTVAAAEQPTHDAVVAEIEARLPEWVSTSIARGRVLVLSEDQTLACGVFERPGHAHRFFISIDDTPETVERPIAAATMSTADDWDKPTVVRMSDFNQRLCLKWMVEH